MKTVVEFIKNVYEFVYEFLFGLIVELLAIFGFVLSATGAIILIYFPHMVVDERHTPQNVMMMTLISIAASAVWFILRAKDKDKK
jgi:hypothetical protein